MESTGNYAAKGGVAMAQKKAGILEMIQCIHNNIDEIEAVMQGTYGVPTQDAGVLAEKGPVAVEELQALTLDELVRANERLQGVRERLLHAVKRF